MLEFNGPVRAHFLPSFINPSTLQPPQGLKRWLLYKASHCTDIKRGCILRDQTKLAFWGVGGGARLGG